MTNWRQETINTYNKSAVRLAEYFRGIGSRTMDINRALELSGNPSGARVVEIGCGDGRDAKEIVKRTNWYQGFDISEELVKLAQAHVPEAQFTVGDAVNFDYPKDLDVIFAFASLLHLDKDETKAVFTKAHEALKPGGIVYISLKYRPEYTEEVKTDEYGRRMFYFYNPELISDIAGEGYEVADTSQEIRGHTEWFEIALRKI